MGHGIGADFHKLPRIFHYGKLLLMEPKIIEQQRRYLYSQQRAGSYGPRRLLHN